MRFEITKGNSLRLIAEDDDALLLELRERNGNDDVGFVADLLEHTGWQPNGKLYRINPVDVGALTDSPLITDSISWTEDGRPIVNGNVWWYPNYACVDLAEQLVASGSVLFQLGSAAIA